ncbi:MAG: S1 RNA-binding domain-containing protein [Chloroflexota bacterium]|nr:S1 RNA-binding domain-containing protein [Chloroflexota bacterium]
MEEVKETVAESVSMEDLSSEALDFDELRAGQLREGVVLAARDEGLVVDIGGKLDGFVPVSDLEKMSEEESAEVAKVGQTVQVLVIKTRDRNGNVELSVSQALEQGDWIEAERLKESEEVYETSIVTSNRGGLLVEFGQLQGFVPMSQLIGFSRIRNSDERYRRLHAMIDKPIMLKVIEVNRERSRLIFSQRAAAKEWRVKRRGQLLEELAPGQIRTGRLSQITSFGLFVNLGGIDGLVHVSELSWGRIEDPSKVYKVGQKVKVQVLNVDVERQRVGLSIKALQADPWDSVLERYSEGDLVKGVVSQVVDFGIFVEIEPGIEGLLHNSELISTDQREELASGKEILVKIIRIEPQRQRIGLSVKQVQLHEWEEWYAGEAE